MHKKRSTTVSAKENSPSSAIRIAGSKISFMLNLPLPNSSIVLIHPEAAPGTVTAFIFVRGISRPLIPMDRRYSRDNAWGDLPDPLMARTVFDEAS